MPIDFSLSLNPTGAAQPPSPLRRHMLVGGLGLWATAFQGAWAQSPLALRLTRIGEGPELSRIESALRTVYGKLGMSVDFADLPAERAVVESNAGRADGETARIVGMEASYPNLRRIDVPLYVNTNSVFVYGVGKHVPVSLEQLSSLERVGIVGGWKASEEATAGWKSVVRLTSYGSALQMLKLGRLDAFLGRSEDTMRAMAPEGLSLADFPNKVVLRFFLFHYLHRKHEALLPVVTSELLRMKGKREAVVDNWMPNT